MSVVVMLGAGASYGSLDCAPYAPPLGNRLFQELRATSATAASISGRLLTLFERDFEEGMAAFREERDVDTTALLRDMGAYFAQFEPGDRNLYHILVRAAAKTLKRVTLVTTNYDVLIEIAASRAGMGVSYGAHPVPAIHVSLLKIHGSCNFLPDLGGGVLRGVQFSRSKANVEAPIRVASSIREILDFCSGEDSLAPAIAVYAPGKAVPFCPSFVRRQQDLWRQTIASARTAYVIGMRVQPSDEHIWNELAEAKCQLLYVGLEPKEFLQWAAAVGRRNVSVLADTFESAIPIMARQFRR